jgi:hypothetical protein
LRGGFRIAELPENNLKSLRIKIDLQRLIEVVDNENDVVETTVNKWIKRVKERDNHFMCWQKKLIKQRVAISVIINRSARETKIRARKEKFWDAFLRKRPWLVMEEGQEV